MSGQTPLPSASDPNPAGPRRRFSRPPWPRDPRGLASTAARELVATARSALFPLARLHPLPDSPSGTLRPVVLVHGYLGHPDMFRPLIRHLYLNGQGAVHTVGYPSTRMDLLQITARIDQVIRALPGPVDLVGHSLGAVACRAWLKEQGGALLVRRFISLGGPHAGTSLYRLTPPQLWPVLDPDGPWVRRLSATPEPVPTIVIRARYDHQVLPSVRASLPGATEIVLNGCGHNGLLWSRRAHRAVADALSAP